MARGKIGRNDPCPCGSGKKFKKCSCGALRNSEEETSPDFTSLLEYLQSQPPTGELRISDVESDLKELIAELQKYDPMQVISAVASLATLADNHTFIFRLDTVILLASLHCRGKLTPSRAVLDHWLNTLVPKSAVGRMEDPAEDFAVGLVRTQQGNRLVLNGYLSGPDAYLQDVLDTLEQGPESLAPLRSTLGTVLRVSDELVAQRGYDRFTSGSGTHEKVMIPESEAALWQLVTSQTFTEANFPTISTFGADAQYFSFTLDEMRKEARGSAIVRSRQRSSSGSEMRIY